MDDKSGDQLHRLLKKLASPNLKTDRIVLEYVSNDRATRVTSKQLLESTFHRSSDPNWFFPNGYPTYSSSKLNSSEI